MIRKDDEKGNKAYLRIFPEDIVFSHLFFILAARHRFHAVPCLLPFLFLFFPIHPHSFICALFEHIRKLVRLDSGGDVDQRRNNIKNRSSIA